MGQQRCLQAWQVKCTKQSPYLLSHNVSNVSDQIELIGWNLQKWKKTEILYIGYTLTNRGGCCECDILYFLLPSVIQERLFTSELVHIMRASMSNYSTWLPFKGNSKLHKGIMSLLRSLLRQSSLSFFTSASFRYVAPLYCRQLDFE